MVYAERGIELPTYDHVGPAEKAEISAIIEKDSKLPPWRTVDRGQEQELDVLVFISSERDHVGVVVDRGRMLHISEGKLSCVERYNTSLWSRRLAGIYRHHSIS